MTLRTRIAVAAGLAVAVTAVAVVAALYIAARAQLRGEVDRALEERADRIDVRGGQAVVARPRLAVGDRGRRGAPPRRPPNDQLRSLLDIPPPVGFGGANGYVQVVRPDGSATRPPDETLALPVTATTRAIAAGRKRTSFSDVTVAGSPLRVLTVPEGGSALQVARPLDEINAVLTRLLVISGIVIAAGIALAIAIGLVVSRTALAPIVRFTRRTESLSGGPDLSHRLEEEGGRDELGRLARSFNRTLDALERSVEAQRHLVADASHELRTPISSLRTNIQVLASGDALPPEDRRQLLADVLGELDELTQLVGDVVDLARGSQPHDLEDEVRLDELVAASLDRVRRRAPQLRFDAELEPTVVSGMADRIDRAVTNLLDNAVKWSPSGAPVEVAVRDGAITVRDHGPGIAEEDLPFVFDRFYRANSARKLPGSGLGLAIVRQVAESHGGRAAATNAPDGGALLRVTFGEPQAQSGSARPSDLRAETVP